MSRTNKYCVLRAQGANERLRLEIGSAKSIIRRCFATGQPDLATNVACSGLRENSGQSTSHSGGVHGP